MMRLTPDLATAGPVSLGDGLYGRVACSVQALVEAGLDVTRWEPVWTSAQWWRFVERDHPHEVLYLIIESADSAPVAVAPALLVRSPQDLLFYNGPKIIGDFSAIGSPGNLDVAESDLAASLGTVVDSFRNSLYPSLTVGVYGSNFGFRAFGTDSPADPSALIPAVARLADALSRRLRLPGFSLLYLDPDQDEIMRASCGDLNLVRALFGAEAFLDVPSGGFDDYLRNLPKSRRTMIRREMRGYAEMGITTRIEEGADALSDEYLPLRTALRAKYGHAAEISWAQREFQSLRDTMGSDLVVFSARRSEQIIGYMMAFRRGTVLFTRAAGFDYEASKGAYCYFNLVYYDVIRWAQAQGVRRVHYGLGTSKAKQARGCSLLPRWAYFRLPVGTPPQVYSMLRLQHTSAARMLDSLA